MNSERALLWTNRHKRAVSFYDALHRQIDRELRFALKLEHYADTREDTPNPTEVQFRGRESYAKLRGMVSDIMAAPRYINTRPVNPNDTDPQLAEKAKFGVEHCVRTEDYGFEEHLERMVLGAIAARYWFMWVEYDEKSGELLFRAGDPTKTFLTPGFNETWDKSMPWLIEEIDISLAEAKTKWPGIDIIADNRQKDRDTHQNGTDLPQNRGSYMPELDPANEGTVKVLRCWSQHDTETVPVETGNQVFDEAGGVQNEVMDMPLFDRGRRYEIVLPGMLEQVADGPWPQNTRGIPCMQLKRNTHPRDYCGLSETKVDHSPQVISNAIMQRMWLQVQATPNMLLAAGEGGAIKDATGNPLEISDDPWLFGYVKDPMALNAMKHFKADPISAGEVNFYRLVNDSLRQDMGGSELGMTPGQSKDIPVGTINQIVESGSKPTDHFIRRMRREMSIFFGNISDMQRETWDVQKWVRMQGPDGISSWQLMQGADIPNADFTITADPAPKAMDGEKAKAILAWNQTGNPMQGGSPAIRRILAGPMGIDPSIIDQLEMAEQQAQMQQQVMQIRAMQMAGGPNGPDGHMQNGAGPRPRFDQPQGAMGNFQ